MDDKSKRPQVYIEGNVNSDVGGVGDVFHGDVNYFKTIYQLYPADEPVPFSPNAAIKNILERSLQSPFGGREKEFAIVNSFLREKECGHIFVTGSSGFGKTTLMSHLIERFKKQNINFIYYFISQRDGTANEDDFLRGLCRQLVNHFKLEGALPDNPSDIRSLYADLLNRQLDNNRLIIVIDGLDEANGWQPNRNIFPATLPKGVFVLFSARQIANKDWLDQLGLSPKKCEIIQLNGLNRDEIIQAFHAAGGKASEWIDIDRFCNDVMDISSRDPFYIQCLLTDIEDGRTTLENIGDEPKTVKVYLDRWWQELQKETGDSKVVDLLGYLVVARGPLGLSDLINIDPSNSSVGLTLDSSLNKVKRFVVGDRETGFKLCHPRLQDFISRRIAQNLTQYEDRLINYCLETWRNSNEYALRHLVAHLFQRGRFKEVHNLLSDPEFLRAKRIKFGSYYSIMEDIFRAIEIAEQEGYDGLQHLIFYSVILAALRTQTGNITLDVIKVLVELGQVGRALNYAKNIHQPVEKARALQIVGGGGFYPLIGPFYRSKARKYDAIILGLAFNESQRIESGDDRKMVLISLASDLAHVGKKAEALQAIEQLDNEYKKTEALKDVVFGLAESGFFVEAFETVINSLEIEDALGDFVERLSWAMRFKKEFLKEVIDEARTMPSQSDRSIFISETVTAMKSVIEKEKAEAPMENRNYQNNFNKAEKIRLSIWLGRYDEALEHIRAIGDIGFGHYYRNHTDEFDIFARGLLILGREDDVQYLTEQGWISNFDETIEIWNNILAKGESNKILTTIIPGLSTWEQAQAIELFGVKLIKEGLLTDVVNFIKEVDQYPGYEFIKVTANLAIHLARNRMFGESEAIIKIADDYVLQRAFDGYAGALIGADLLEDVIPAGARLIKSENKRCEWVAYIAEKLATEDKGKATLLLDGALTEAETPKEAEYKVGVLVAIAGSLVTDSQLEKALDISTLFVEQKPYVWSDIAGEYIAKASKTENANAQLGKMFQVIDAIPDERKKQTTACCLAISLAKYDQLDLAVTTSDKINDTFWQKAFVLAVLAGIASKNNKKLANKLLNKAIKIARKFGRNTQEKDYFFERCFSLSYQVNDSMLDNLTDAILLPYSLSEREEEIDVDYGLFVITAALISTGWIDKSLLLANKLKREVARKNIEMGILFKRARLGDKVDTLISDIKKVGASSFSNEEQWAIEYALKMIEVQHCLNEEDYDAAEKIIQDIISLYKKSDTLHKNTETTDEKCDTEQDDWSSLEFIISMGFSLVPDNKLAQALYKLQDKIYTRAPKIKLKEQFDYILFLLYKNDQSAAEVVAASIDDVVWKRLALALTESRRKGIDRIERNHVILSIVQDMHQIENYTKNHGDGTDWIPSTIVDIIMDFGEFNNPMSVMSNFGYLKSNLRLENRIIYKLIEKGMVDEAFRIVNEMGTAKYEHDSSRQMQQTINMLIPELAKAEPDKILKGIHQILQASRLKEYESIYDTVTAIIPLIQKIGGYEAVFDVFKTISQVESFWKELRTDTNSRHNHS